MKTRLLLLALPLAFVACVPKSEVENARRDLSSAQAKIKALEQELVAAKSEANQKAAIAIARETFTLEAKGRALAAIELENRQMSEAAKLQAQQQAALNQEIDLRLRDIKNLLVVVDKLGSKMFIDVSSWQASGGGTFSDYETRTFSAVPFRVGASVQDVPFTQVERLQVRGSPIESPEDVVKAYASYYRREIPAELVTKKGGRLVGFVSEAQAKDGRYPFKIVGKDVTTDAWAQVSVKDIDEVYSPTLEERRGVMAAILGKKGIVIDGSGGARAMRSNQVVGSDGAFDRTVNAALRKSGIDPESTRGRSIKLVLRNSIGGTKSEAELEREVRAMLESVGQKP